MYSPTFVLVDPSSATSFCEERLPRVPDCIFITASRFVACMGGRGYGDRRLQFALPAGHNSKFAILHVAAGLAMGGVPDPRAEYREAVYWAVLRLYELLAANFQRRWPRNSTAGHRDGFTNGSWPAAASVDVTLPRVCPKSRIRTSGIAEVRVISSGHDSGECWRSRFRATSGRAYTTS